MTSAGFASKRREAARVLIFLVVLQFFYAWAWNTIDVLRPAFRAALALSLTQVGAGYSAQVVGALAGGLAVVRFEHVIGRQHAMAIVAIGIGVTLLAGLIVTNWPAFLVQRFAVGMGGGAVFPLTIGVIAELFESRIRGRLASLIDSTYFAAVVALGFAAGQADLTGWRTLLWVGGIPPLLFAFAAYKMVPSFPSAADAAPDAPVVRRGIGDLFTPAVRTRTLVFATMLGANACGYQAFSGWITTYLYDVARLPSATIGNIVACQFSGSVVGCIGWGWAIDRFGRRTGALGLLSAAAAVTAFLMLPAWPYALGTAAFAFGVAFSAIVSIGPWLAELYPPELRTPATSMFQWGRFVSLLAPLATGGLAAQWGLSAAMTLSIASFMLAGWLWSRLPETLARDAQHPNRVKA